MKTLTEQQLQTIAESVLRESEDDLDRALRMFSNSSGARSIDPGEGMQEVNAIFDVNLERLYVQNNRVWRGIALANWSDMEPDFDFRYKKILYDPLWMSTSTQRHTAENYMRDRVT